MSLGVPEVPPVVPSLLPVDPGVPMLRVSPLVEGLAVADVLIVSLPPSRPLRP